MIRGMLVDRMCAGRACPDPPVHGAVGATPLPSFHCHSSGCMTRMEIQFLDAVCRRIYFDLGVSVALLRSVRSTSLSKRSEWLGGGH